MTITFKRCSTYQTDHYIFRKYETTQGRTFICITELRLPESGPLTLEEKTFWVTIWDDGKWYLKDNMQTKLDAARVEFRKAYEAKLEKEKNEKRMLKALEEFNAITSRAIAYREV